jgi:hypothetical protein
MTVKTEAVGEKPVLVSFWGIHTHKIHMDWGTFWTLEHGVIMLDVAVHAIMSAIKGLTNYLNKGSQWTACVWRSIITIAPSSGALCGYKTIHEF